MDMKTKEKLFYDAGFAFNSNDDIDKHWFFDGVLADERSKEIVSGILLKYIDETEEIVKELHSYEHVDVADDIRDFERKLKALRIIYETGRKLPTRGEGRDNISNTISLTINTDMVPKTKFQVSSSIKRKR